MATRRSLIVAVACLGLAACGGSSTRSVSDTTASTHSGPASSGAVAATTTSSPTTTAAATTSSTTTSTATTSSATTNAASSSETTTSTTTRPPEVPHGKGDRHPAGGTERIHTHVATTVAVRADGSLSPPVISIPALVNLDLHLVNRDSAAHSVVLAVPSRPTLHLAPGAASSASVPFLHGGTYRILVDGSPRGQLLVGAQGGP